MKPLVIGIAGDSCSGKTTLSNLLLEVFGPDNVQCISGDNYHVAERHDPVWDKVTHLDPAANHLDLWAADVASLCGRKKVARRMYDHHIGRFGDTGMMEPRRVMISEGLHTFYTPELRKHIDIAIYMDIDETLRRNFKMIRDTQKRSYTEAETLAQIERRMPDAQRYLHTQKEHADLIFMVEPSPDNAQALNVYNAPYKLSFRGPPGSQMYNNIHFCIERAPALRSVFFSDGQMQVMRLHPGIDHYMPQDFISLAQQCFGTRGHRPVTWLGGTRGAIQFMMLLSISVKRPDWF